ncbi:MAG: C40 family peptidase [Bacteroidetes bacterium]|nr:C40 family peptidase [Bacteroidota bacterium]MBU1717926.1 C40 family peptidase [Bacteroidota bacterium]
MLSNMSGYSRIIFPFLIFLFLVSCHQQRQFASDPGKDRNNRPENNSGTRKNDHREKGDTKLPRETGKMSNSEIETYSSKLGIKLDGSENKLLITTAIDWLGAPYKYASNSKNGTDCSGLAGNIYRIVYGFDLKRSAADIFSQALAVKKQNLKEGDLIFFKIAKNRVSHVGVFIKDGYFIHASTKKGVIISHLSEEYYTKYFFAAGRISDSD